MSPLRLGLEVTTLAQERRVGIGRYASSLLAALHEQAGDQQLRIRTLCHLSQFGNRRYVQGQARRELRYWRDFWLPPRGVDLVHATSWRVPTVAAPVKIATIHDVYAALGINTEQSAQRDRQMRRFRHVAQHAHRVICVSARSQQDFLEHFDFDPARTDVVHLGVDDHFRPQPHAECEAVRREFSEGSPYLLALGAYRSNKNIERLIDAYSGSPLRHDLCLLIVGRFGDEDRARLAARLSDLGASGRVKLVGYVDEARLPVLYAAAAALAFPSTYEGFGLPILEAMACGTPVMTSTAGSCPEVAAGHAVLVDPESVDSIRAGLDSAVRLSAGDRDAAQRYARSKTWQQTAARTIDIYREALRSSR